MDQMPTLGVMNAHLRSSYHRPEIEKAEACGCFHCLEHFRPSSIVEWVDGGLTALCPRCGIDAVLPSGTEVSIRKEFLAEMRAYWFGARCGDEL